MDFVADTLAHGRTFRVLTIIDEHTRECLSVETDTSLPGLRVIRVLEHLAQTRGLPEEIHVDYGLNASKKFRISAETGLQHAGMRTVGEISFKKAEFPKWSSTK
jgi:transposase InsO family protein